ncbi:MAG: hypothetical protein ABF318_10570, partial [Ketobacter sp.]
MNVILIQPREWGSNSTHGQIVLGGERHRHIRTVLQPVVGDQLRVGLLGGHLGMHLEDRARHRHRYRGS